MLIILLLGIAYFEEMLPLLDDDMKDEEERRGFYGVGYGDQGIFHASDVISAKNQARFVDAQRLTLGLY